MNFFLALKTESIVKGLTINLGRIDIDLVELLALRIAFLALTR